MTRVDQTIHLPVSARCLLGRRAPFFRSVSASALPDDLHNVCRVAVALQSQATIQSTMSDIADSAKNLHREAIMVRDGRLFDLTVFDWSVLCVGVVVSGVLMLFF